MDSLLQNSIERPTHTSVQRTPAWEKNSRTAGSMPTYGTHQSIENTGDYSVSAHSLRAIEPTQTPEFNTGTEDEDSGFSFFDLLDMINPLQHIPLVNIAYRKITGDEIKPISSIVGGAVFGGPIGAVGGIANAVIHDATGKGMIENVVALSGLSSENETEFSYKRHSSIEEKTAYQDLPASLLSFAQTPTPKV